MFSKSVVLGVVGLVAAGFFGATSVAANQSQNSAMQCGGVGLNPGQAWQLPYLLGGPAAGEDRTQTPPQFAKRMGAGSVGELLRRDCDQVK